jgi:hypothetical protein
VAQAVLAAELLEASAQRWSTSSRSSGWALAANEPPISAPGSPPVKRSQPSLTNVTSPSASVIHMSAGVVSASSRNCASLSTTTSS